MLLAQACGPDKTSTTLLLADHWVFATHCAVLGVKLPDRMSSLVQGVGEHDGFLAEEEFQGHYP